MDVGVILAGGRSERFGPDDKLLAALEGRPLVAHAYDALVSVVARVLIVAGSDAVAQACPGAEPVLIDNGATGQSDSLIAGIGAARALGATRAVVVLGDMPFVPSEHLAAVRDAAVDGASASWVEGRAMPPACFPAAWFPPLLALRGDRGAAPLLRGLPREVLIPLSSEAARDIDTPEALALGRTSRS